MRYFLIFLLCLLSVSSYGQGVAIRAADGLGTNLSLRATGTNNSLTTYSNNFNWGGNGDVNFSGTISVADVTSIGLMTLTTNWTQEKYARGDINGDGIVNATDYYLVSQINSGIWTLSEAQRQGKTLVGAAVWVDSLTNAHYNYQVSIGENFAEPPSTPAFGLYVKPRSSAFGGVRVDTVTGGPWMFYGNGTNSVTTIGPNGGLMVGGTNHVGAGTGVFTNRVGIGTNAPAVPLHAVQVTAAGQSFRLDDTNYTARWQFGTIPGNPGFGAIWGGNVTPSSVNPALFSDGATATVLSSLGTVNLANGGLTQWVVDGVSLRPQADNAEFLGDSTHRIARIDVGTAGITNAGPMKVDGVTYHVGNVGIGTNAPAATRETFSDNASGVEKNTSSHGTLSLMETNGINTIRSNLNFTADGTVSIGSVSTNAKAVYTRLLEVKNTGVGNRGFVADIGSSILGMASNLVYGIWPGATTSGSADAGFSHLPGVAGGVAVGNGTLGSVIGSIATSNGIYYGSIALRTNAIPTVTVPFGYLWNSNSALYWVTATKTNLITDGL